MREKKAKSDCENFHKINLLKIVLIHESPFQNDVGYTCQCCPQLKRGGPVYVLVLR